MLPAHVHALPARCRRRRCRGPAASALGVVLGVVLGLPGPAAGQEHGTAGTVRGVVLEARSDRPVRGARVVLVAMPAGGAAADTGGEAVSLRERGPGMWTAVTGADGAYAFESVPPGRYRVEVASFGYRPAEVGIELPTRWELHRSVALEVEPLALQPVDVVMPSVVSRVAADFTPLKAPPVSAPDAVRAGASPLLYGLDVRVLDARTLPGVGTLGEPDVFRALQRLPGVSARGDFSADIWTRGAPWGMTQVLLDGLPLFDPLHLGGIASGLAAEGLESAALLPGVRPASGAEGAAGTIALRSRRAGPGRSGSVALSSMAVRGHLEQRLLEERVGVVVTARRSWWDLLRPPGLLSAAGSDGVVDYHFADVAARLDARLGPLGLLEAGGVWEEDRLFGEIPDLVAPSRGRWGNRLGWVRLGRRLGAVEAETMVGRVDYRMATRPFPWTSFLGPRGAPSLDHVETDISHATWKTTLRGGLEGGRFTWGAGVGVVRETLDQFGADASDRSLPGVGGTAELGRAQGWMEAALDLGRADLAGGVRLDRLPDETPATPALPSVRVRWRALPWLTLEGARGSAVQFLYPFAPAGASLGPALRTGYVWIMAVDGTPPMVSHTSSVGARMTVGQISAHVTAWLRVVEGVSFPGIAALDAGELRSLEAESPVGVERGRGLEGRVGWRADDATVEVSYTLSRSRFSAADVTPWPSPAERRHSVDVDARWRVGREWSVGADFTAESGWPTMLGPPAACGDELLGCVDPEEDDVVPSEYSLGRAPAYASLDLEVQWVRAWEWVGLEVTGSLRNALGRHNAAAYRSGTCDGRVLVSSVCEQLRGLGRYSPGLTSPAFALAVGLRF